MTNIPTYDYFEHRNPDDYGQLDWLIQDLTRHIEKEYFLPWEAVSRQEQGLKLSRKYKKILRGLLNFSDDDGPILYIDEMPRPSQSWHEIIRLVVPKLLIEKIDTTDGWYKAAYEGWPNLEKALKQHGRHLSLPDGVKSAIDVVSIDIQHRLWLQFCFDGFGTRGRVDAGKYAGNRYSATKRLRDFYQADVGETSSDIGKNVPATSINYPLKSTENR
jgi:hypothetical protein